ncbi:MAG: SpoIIE family protein phosphatase [Bryobacterales bacterium]|nr:SpoIIE family protein phosphatase [Bryobacterales bacterium]
MRNRFDSLAGQTRRGLARRWAELRWKLLVCYILIGGVSVLLVAAFGATAANLLILRGSAVAVERQVDLVIQSAAARTAQVAVRLEAQAQWRLDRGDPPPPPPRPPIAGPGVPQTIGVVRCTDEQGQTRSFVQPPGATLEVPAWLSEDSFRGLVAENQRIFIYAFTRRTANGCTVEAASRTPLNQDIVEILSSASELRVDLPRLTRPEATSPPDPGFLLTVALRQLTFQQGRVPVITSVNDWATGAPEDRLVLLVQPDYGTLLRQLSRFGQRQALWIWTLWTLAIAFIVVETIALILAIRVTRRIIGSVDALSIAAHEVGAGNFRHRIEVRDRDQLGKLSASFNEMTESLERLMREREEKLRLERELHLAREIQLSLFRRTMPEIDGVELAATCLPARNISGDLYDVVQLAPHRVGLLCADVSGKGISAALLASTIQTLVRSARQTGEIPPPAEFVARLNEQLCRWIPSNQFVTLFWAEYDTARHVLRFTNAGHCPAFLWGGNGEKPRRLETGGVPIGIFCGAEYSQAELAVPPGSVLLVYTDGITEAEDPRGEEFGDERLEQLVNELGKRPAREMIEQIVSTHREWAQAASADDVTLLVMRTG